MSDGPLQVQPVWGSFDGTHILVNAEKSRQKYRNLSRRRAVTILAIDPDDDSRWLEVRGTVVSETGGAPTGTSMSWRGSIWRRQVPVPPRRRRARALQDRAAARRDHGVVDAGFQRVNLIHLVVYKAAGSAAGRSCES
jgi:hypothetical protein